MCISCDTCCGWKCKCEGVEHCSWFESNEPCATCGGTYQEYVLARRTIYHDGVLKDHQSEPWYTTLARALGSNRVSVRSVFRKPSSEGPPWYFEVWIDGEKIEGEHRDSAAAYIAAGLMLLQEGTDERPNTAVQEGQDAAARQAGEAVSGDS